MRLPNNKASQQSQNVAGSDDDNERLVPEGLSVFDMIMKWKTEIEAPKPVPKVNDVAKNHVFSKANRV